ncbi:MAG: COX15/CtaA family protein [Acidimicrobiales bacterium]|nr:COX15/CtaA family protein [Acidimicrobiales bacterium]
MEASNARAARPRIPTLSPAGFSRVTLFAVWALALTVISGAAVRLTGSGLGCPNWPNCTAASVAAPMHIHAWIEFGNRLINAIVTVTSLGTVVAAWRRRPRRRDLTILSVGLVVGLVVEIVMGAVVVYSKLAPGLVSVHFLLGMAFLALAVVLHHRAAIPDESHQRRPVVGLVQIKLAQLMLVALAVVASLGTVVTSTGPHGGDPKAPRFHLSLHAVAQLHGTAVEVFLGITLVNLWLLVRHGGPAGVVREAQVMLAALALQAVVGYTQYLDGDPVALVAVHVAGASVLVIAALRFYMSLWSYAPAASAVPSTTAGALAVVAATPAGGGA